MNTAKVYVTQIPARRENGAWVPTVDIVPAREFGELKIIIPSGINLPTAEIAVEQVRKGLLEFKPESDYLLLLGDPLLIVAATAIIASDASLKLMPLKLLKWDRRQSRYFDYSLFV